MKVALISANLGKFCNHNEWEKQEINPDIELSIFRLDDNNFPPRDKSLTSRMQAKIPKVFGWQMFPGFDYYIWIDARFEVKKGFVQWMVDQNKNFDCSFFTHPWRHSIKEEADMMNIALKSKFHNHYDYIQSRYTGEFIDEQLEIIFKDKSYKDNYLLAATTFIYKNNDVMKNILSEWWLHISRYCIMDQFILPYLLRQYKCNLNIIQDDVFHAKHAKYIK